MDDEVWGSVLHDRMVHRLSGAGLTWHHRLRMNQTQRRVRKLAIARAVDRRQTKAPELIHKCIVENGAKGLKDPKIQPLPAECTSVLS